MVNSHSGGKASTFEVVNVIRNDGKYALPDTYRDIVRHTNGGIDPSCRGAGRQSCQPIGEGVIAVQRSGVNYLRNISMA